MKSFIEHYSGIKVANDGEVFVPFIHKYPEHYTFGTKLKSGHLCVSYRGKLYRVHRLVAEVFLNGNKPIDGSIYAVHHINGDKTDNRVENLLIMTHSEHSRLHHIDKTFSEETRRKISIMRTGAGNPRSKPTIGINKTTGEIIEFSCTCEASRVLKIKQSHIAECCRGERKSAGGHYWYYA